MINIKASVWLLSAALVLSVLAPVANAAGMAPSGNFVSLRVNGGHVAYGLILSPTKILVPAHAVGGSVSTYSILAGSPDRTVTGCATCQMRSAVAAIRHPNFNTSMYNNDVAVVHVPALTFNAQIFAGSIAAPFSNAVGTQFTQVGFGNGGSNYNRLHTTVVSPWSLKTMPGYVFTLGDFVTATVSPNPNQPMVVNGMINYYNSATQTQVYTKLPDHAAWINAN